MYALLVRKPLPTFREVLCLYALLVRKPLPTFREVLLLLRTSYPKTASHFSGSALTTPDALAVDFISILIEFDLQAAAIATALDQNPQIPDTAGSKILQHRV